MKKWKPNIGNLIKESKESFPSFVDLVLSEYAKSNNFKLRTINVHWAPMNMKYQYCDVTYDVIGRMVETFADFLKYIMIKNKLEHTLKYFSKLRKSQIRSLYKMYRMDFELFGYNAEEYLK